MMGSLCVLGQGGTWQISVPLPQFCHKPKLLCKIQFYQSVLKESTLNIHWKD